jgi:hypothetical protein
MTESRKERQIRATRAGAWGVGAVALCTLGLALAMNGTNSTEAQPLPEALPANNAHQFVGVGSCTAAGCHGDGNPDAIVGSEYNIWISRDPHANAYSDLFNERSQRMVRLLAGNTDKPITPAHEDPRCLACHSTVNADTADAVLDEHVLEFASDGVGCEACHGPARDWIAEHGDGGLNKSRRSELGMTETKSLRVRAEVCVACHVGSPGRDVNHDLIAAGHPRLQFSMTAYWEALPKHWRDKKDRKQLNANFDAALWAFGQAETAAAALRQLERRAAPGQPWPEFAELSCTACHHDLRNDATLQQAVKNRNNLSGRLIASDPWNLFAPRELASEMSAAFGGDEAAAGGLERNLTELADNLNNLDASMANQARVQSAAGTAAEQVTGWAREFRADQLDRQRVNVLMRAVVAHALAEKDADWSTLSQAYDALASLQQTQLQHGEMNADDSAVTKLLAQLFDDLSAAPGRSASSQAARRRLIELGQLLSTAGGSP